MNINNTVNAKNVLRGAGGKVSSLQSPVSSLQSPVSSLQSPVSSLQRKTSKRYLKQTLRPYHYLLLLLFLTILISCGCPAENTVEPKEIFVTNTNITIPATNIDILGNNPLGVTNGRSGTLMAAVTPEDHTEGPIIWTSDNSQVLTIDSQGTYRAMTAGNATITARVGSETDTITIEVNLPATAIEIANGNETINTLIGNDGTLTVTVTPKATPPGK